MGLRIAKLFQDKTVISENLNIYQNLVFLNKLKRNEKYINIVRKLF